MTYSKNLQDFMIACGLSAATLSDGKAALDAHEISELQKKPKTEQRDKIIAEKEKGVRDEKRMAAKLAGVALYGSALSLADKYEEEKKQKDQNKRRS